MMDYLLPMVTVGMKEDYVYKLPHTLSGTDKH